MKFDVNHHPDGIELLPRFFRAELSDDKKEKYEELIDKYTVQNGGIILPENVREFFEPGEIVDFEEVVDELLKSKNSMWRAGMYDYQLSVSYTDGGWK